MKGEREHFGTLLKARRIKQGLTLREFCKRAKADPGNISRIERCRLAPPQDNRILARYLGALGIGEGTDDWHHFVDVANAAQGIVPRDLCEDEEIAGLLPAFFRTLRAEKPSKREMRAVVHKILSDY